MNLSITNTADDENRTNTNEAVVDEILAVVREEVIQILAHDPDIDLAFEGCLSNAKAAVRTYRERSIPHFRLRDGARDMILALACLQLNILSRMSPEERDKGFEEAA
jgi:hypothetical protein